MDHVWVGSKFYFEVKWKDGTSTLEPESSLKEDDPHTLAFYLQRSGLSHRSKRCQWANSAFYIGESTGGGNGSDGNSVNFSSDEEETKITLEDEDATKEASRTDGGGCNYAKLFAVRRSSGASCTLSSGTIFLSHQDAVEHAGNQMTQSGNDSVKGFDSIGDALLFASSSFDSSQQWCKRPEKMMTVVFSLHLKHHHSHLLLLLRNTQQSRAQPTLQEITKRAMSQMGEKQRITVC